MDGTFRDGCGDDHGDDACPICRGDELSPEFIAMIEQAAARPRQVMTGEEVIEWLRSL
jgi:hypothetical protein